MASRPCRATATLEVTPLDAQKLALGQQLGQLSLVLRKPGEEQNIPYVETVSLDDLRYSYYGSAAPAGRGAKPDPAACSPPPPRASAHRAAQPAASRAGPPGRRAGQAVNQHGECHQGN